MKRLKISNSRYFALLLSTPFFSLVFVLSHALWSSRYDMQCSPGMIHCYVNGLSVIRNYATSDPLVNVFLDNQKFPILMQSLFLKTKSTNKGVIPSE